MSKDYCGFENETGETGFLAGVIDVISDNLGMVLDFAEALDADIFYVKDNDISLLKTKATIIKIEDSRQFLHSIGINGEIIRTSSHSEDSISVILDNGDCFVGDLELIEYLPAYENNIKLKYDWDFDYEPSAT